MAALIELSELVIAQDDVNACVMEHMSIILCLVVYNRRDDTIRLFNRIMASEYQYYVSTFLLDVLEKGAQSRHISIKARPISKDEAKRRHMAQTEFSVKLISPSSTISGKEFASNFDDHKNFSTEREQAMSDMRSMVEYARDQLLGGAVHLVTVFSQAYMCSRRC